MLGSWLLGLSEGQTADGNRHRASFAPVWKALTHASCRTDVLLDLQRYIAVGLSWLRNNRLLKDSLGML